MGSPEWRAKIDDLYKSFASGEAGDKRWARPDAPILHSLPDEKAEPHVFFHNSNYRISRKYINTEKVKVRDGTAWQRVIAYLPHITLRMNAQILKQQSLECVRSTGHARYHKCQEVRHRSLSNIIEAICCCLGQSHQFRA